MAGAGRPNERDGPLLPAYGTTGSSDPLSMIQMSERLGSKVVDATIGSSKVSVTQPPHKPGIGTTTESAPLASISLNHRHGKQAPVPEVSNAGTPSTSAGEGASLGEAKKRVHGSSGSLGSNGHLRSSEKLASNSSITSDSSFDASFNTSPRPHQQIFRSHNPAPSRLE